MTRLLPTRRAVARPGYSLVGLLITMAMIVVLMSILLTSMNKAMTGEGSTVEGTVNTMEDQIQLNAMYQGFAVWALENRGRFLVPSDLTRSADTSVDTTANMYAAMIAGNYLSPEIMVSPNEYGNVYPDDDFNYNAVQPQDDVYWDPKFSADLYDESNVSYAHVPLFDERLRRHWKNTSRFPVFGNRGPKDGVEDPESYTYGRNGRWAGHMVFGDGSIEFLHTFTPGKLDYTKDGVSTPDNIFKIETGPTGIDAILSFTKAMTAEGPVLDWD